MKLFKNLSIVAVLAISGYAGSSFDGENDSGIMQKNNTISESPKAKDLIVGNSGKTYNSVSPNSFNENSNNNFDNSSVHKENDVIGFSEKTELLKDPEVIRLLNDSYKKGFIQGSEESKLIMKKKIEKMGRFMDELFAFHKLYLEGKLEPPKIGVVSEPIQVAKDGKVMVIQQEYLEIIEPAKFVDKPKTWKNFMLE